MTTAYTDLYRRLNCDDQTTSLEFSTPIIPSRTWFPPFEIVVSCLISESVCVILGYRTMSLC